MILGISSILNVIGSGFFERKRRGLKCHETVIFTSRINLKITHEEEVVCTWSSERLGFFFGSELFPFSFKVELFKIFLTTFVFLPVAKRLT